MANVDAPRGLRWVGAIDGSKKPKIIHVEVAAATVLYQGCLVEIAVTTGLGILPAAAALNVDAKLMGVSVGYKPATSANEDVPVIIGQGQIFEIQAGGVTTNLDTEAEFLTALHAGTRYGFLAGATGVTGLNLSAMELDCAATGTDDGVHIFQLYDIPERPDNAFGANMKVLVRIPDSVFIPSVRA
jgi:hypothetical protein